MLSSYTQSVDGEYIFNIFSKVSDKGVRKTYSMGDTISGMKIVDFDKVLVPHYNDKTKVTHYHDRSILDLSSKEKIKLIMFEFHSLNSTNNSVKSNAVKGGR